MRKPKYAIHSNKIGCQCPGCSGALAQRRKNGFKGKSALKQALLDNVVSNK